MITDSTGVCGAQGRCVDVQRVVDRTEVWAAVHPAEVRRGGRISLVVPRGLGVGEWVSTLHTR